MRTALYRFYDARDALLYVGITDNLEVRLRQHASDKPWWPDVQRHTYEWFESRGEAEAAEIVAIKGEYPRYNKFHAVTYLSPEERLRWYGPDYSGEGRPDPDSAWVPVGVDRIAAHLGVSENTVIAWRRRSAEWVNVAKFPESEGKISGRDWWWLSDVLDWAKETGRKAPAAGE